MSLSGAHKAAFRREAAQKSRVFSIRDQDGYPGAGGRPTAPGRCPSGPSRPARTRWSARSPHTSDFDVVEIGMDDWLDHWLPGLEQNGYLVGVNWAGARATGYDMAPALVARWFAERS